MFSLITEPWLPVIDIQGQRRKVSPAELADHAIIDLAWPRADFQGAAYQLLIGLLQTAFAPKDEGQWEDIWNEGIDPDSWRKALDRVAGAMRFGPQKPAFLQDYSTLDVENSPIAGLLIDAPGGNTVKLNKDHFVKRSHYQHFCPHCTAMALYTVQTNSPAGGAGFRTSMRGGGPLTTLLMPVQSGEPLWRKLWLNVMPAKHRWADEHLHLIFPWLTETRSSETAKNIVTPENSHPLQAYWGMPRRLEIDFSHTQRGECDLCGEHHDALLSQIRSKNYGVQYDGWVHPLSPYRQGRKDTAAPVLCLKGQPGGLAYKDWLGLVMTTEDKLNRTLPARIAQRNPRPGATGLWCFGFDMDNAKARCWYEHRLPMIRLGSDESESFSDLISMAVELATSTRPLLVQALKEANSDSSMAEMTFWQQTESGFRQLWQALSQHPSALQPQARAALREWGETLQRWLLQIFDQRAFTYLVDSADLLQILIARFNLIKNFRKLNSLKKIKEIAIWSTGSRPMFETHTGKELIIVDAAPGLIRRWFRSLQERYCVDPAFTGNGRAWRAELRHVQPPYGALTSLAFHHLSGALTGERMQVSDRLALAIFAGVAAHAHHDNTTESFARQLSEEIKGRPCLSRLRFERLLAARTPTELAAQLMRAVKLRGAQGVNLVSLADGICLWMREWQAKEEHLAAERHPFNRIAVRWASEYLHGMEKSPWNK